MTWQEVKKITDTMPVPNIQKATLSATVTMEGKDKDKHVLNLYKFSLHKDPEFEIEYRWTVCPICHTVGYQKIIAWNNVESVCYERLI